MSKPIKNHRFKLLRIILFLTLGIINSSYAQETSLFKDISKGNLNSVKRFLNTGGNPNIKGSVYACNGVTALSLATVNNQVEIIKLLLNKGADPNGESDCANFPLIIAVINNHIELTKILLNYGANVNTKSDYNNGNKAETALMAAAVFGHTKIVHLLLSKNADVNLKNNEGETALHYACFSGFSDSKIIPIIKELLEHGANINEKDKNGVTPLMKASGNMTNTPNEMKTGAVPDFPKRVQFLLKNGATIDDKDNDGKTALMYATYSYGRKHNNVVKILKTKTGHNESINH